MDQNKKSKVGAYCGELVRKSGLLAPAFCGALMFIVLFYVRFIDMFVRLKAASELGYWFVLVASLIGIVLLIVYLALGLKSNRIERQDKLLLTLDFLMVYLLVGMIAFNFLTLETVYYGVALVVVIVLNVLRAIFFAPESLTEKKAPRASNITIKKYFDLVFGRFGMWRTFIAALGGYGFASLIMDVWGFRKFFLGSYAVTAGIMLAVLVFGIVFVISYVKRVLSREISFVDGMLLFMFFTVILCGLLLINHYSAINLAVWALAVILMYALLCILGLSTHHDEEQTDDAYFATDGGRKFVKNPKVYFKKLVSSFNIVLLCAISMFLFAALASCVLLNVMGAISGWFMFYVIVAMLIYYFTGLAYFARGLKISRICNQDGLLWIFDVALLLLTIVIFTNFSMSGMITSVIIWAIAFVTTLGFTIARLFKVREAVDEVEASKNEAASEE